MKRMVIATSALIGCLLLSASIAIADIPQVLNYQGRLSDSLGYTVADGDYTMTFTLYTAAEGGTDIWSCAGQIVPVTDGLFTYHLGDACTLPDDLFADYSSVWLGIAIGGDPESTPRTQIVSSAYAFHSLRADTAGYVAGTSSAQGWIDDGNVVRLETAGDSVGIGTTTPEARLDVAGSVNTADWYEIKGERFVSDSGNGNVFVGVHAGQGNAGISNTIIGYDAGVDNTGSNNVFVGRACGQTNTEGTGNTFIGVNSGTSNSGGNDNTYVGYNAGISATGTNNTYLGRSAGASAAGFGNVYIGRDAGYFETGNNQLFIANSSSSTPLIYGDFENRLVGIGTTSPDATLDAINESGTAIRGEASGVMVNAILGTTSSSGGSGVTGFASGITSSGVSGFATGENGKGVYGHAALEYSYAVYGIALGASSYGLYGEADSSYGIAVYGQTDGSNGVGVYGEATAADGYGVSARSRAENGVALFARSTLDGGIGIEAHGGSGGYAAKFSGNVILVSPGDGGTILELGEGLDYAEGFDNAGNLRLEPGTVLIIDKDNPGKLDISRTPYDNKVAGIVAGANGLGSGVRLGSDRYDMDVALAGRVYCNIDATLAGIEPGDLLTTSTTPGYAMKAVDYDLARGAILGKAMEPLAKGQKGRILVLVTLQ